MALVRHPQEPARATRTQRQDSGQAPTVPSAKVAISSIQDASPVVHLESTVSSVLGGRCASMAPATRVLPDLVIHLATTVAPHVRTTTVLRHAPVEPRMGRTAAHHVLSPPTRVAFAVATANAVGPETVYAPQASVGSRATHSAQQ